ncbi:IS1595 family transposase [Methylocella tundrae]|uniref:Transposase n=1 Tax=Methylocella tundrae TaxID=227605 RepID=A0A4U8YZE8_METTU|nr:IS1595 family transposase [Methylocella tundrae]WPP05928.1 IS1595 family transposase [Methylocella tundrae]VFU08477.1 transposase [Methylocella tundrae]
MSDLSNPIFHDETKAREWLEARIWPNGPTCPHCSNADQSRIKSLQGKAHRAGLYQCAECREQFTVTIKTVFERSKIPLTKWLAALFLLCSSKKGMSTHQMHRMLGISYKSTWFMTHRLREAMRTGGLSPLGGEGKTVEIDETIIGRQEGSPPRKGMSGSQFRNTVLTLVERGGAARSWHVDGTSIGALIPIIRANVAKETAVMTDSASWYKFLNKDGDYASHDTVRHEDKEYGRYEGEKVITTNTVEGFYSIFKRGMKGVYQHCGERHLHRYLAEFDFRYSTRAALGINDVERAEILAKGIVGKRLTYRRPNQAGEAVSR